MQRLLQITLLRNSWAASGCLQQVLQHACGQPGWGAQPAGAWSRGNASLWTCSSRMQPSAAQTPSPAAAAADGVLPPPRVQQHWLAAGSSQPPHPLVLGLCSSSCRCAFTTSAAAAAADKPAGKRKQTVSLVPPQQQRRMAELDFKAVTLGTVFDQYTHPVSYWQSGAFPSPKKTWAYIKKGMARWFNERQARTAVRSNIPGGFSTEAFHEEMADIYLRVQRAQAQMQPDLARDLVSRDVFIKMRAQTEQRRKQGWREITWEVLDEEQLSKNIKQVRARTLKLVEKSPFDWLQFTFCITSKQRFAAYGVDGDKRPCRLAGDESQVLDVTEYVVFERKTRARVRMAGGPLPTLGKAEHIEGSRWRLVAWLEP